MFKITWDSETGGILLNLDVSEDTLSVSPRPVFWEELDLLQMNNLEGGNAWTYPHCKEPLLWACNKQYYYRGEFVFEVKGANIYDNANVILKPGAKGLVLQPVDMAAMLEKNRNQMFVVESEAIEYIRDVYIMYSSARKIVEEVKANRVNFEAMAAAQEKRTGQKMAIILEECNSFDIMPLKAAEEKGKRIYQTTRVDRFLASFSGGKDSQVILDLVTRAIPPHAFEVIYSDTGYELPPSLTLYEEVKSHYKNLYPDLKISMAYNHEEVLHYWDRIGTPSDTHRWCCSIMKTAPLYKKLKQEGTNKQARVLTFDGVRAEESTRRASYSRIGKGVKHDTVINVSPILYWNSCEIFLYLFKYELPINPAYRQGMTRVGCLICPFSSEWNDMISNKSYTAQVQPFLSRIETLTAQSGVKDVKDYIKAGNWKRRAGGRGIAFPSHLEILSTKPNLKMKLTSPQKDVLLWLHTVCEYNVSGENPRMGEIRYKKKIYPFTITTQGNEHTIEFLHVEREPTLQGLLKRAFYKATYCINCETCEVECPTGALSILPDVYIDKMKCTHCHKCLEFEDTGCIVAKSLTITGNNLTNSNHMKLIGYNNFGLRGAWLDGFFSSMNTYFTDNNHGLNIKEQLPNFVKWLVQAEILDDTRNKQVTGLGKILSQCYLDRPELVWEIIWINLSYNSPIAKWYKENVDWGREFSEAEIRELVTNNYMSESTTTIRNVVYALFRTFRESPIGKMGLLVEKGKLQYEKVPYEDLSKEAIAYSLYKYSAEKKIKLIRITDLYGLENNQGIYREFGVPKERLEKALRSLNSAANRVLVAELNMGLDHITVREDLDPLEALRILLNK